MFRAGSPTDLPSWEALRESSEPSGDGDSDMEEVDQIRATPAPSSFFGFRSERPLNKRKESDWRIESAPKRPKHDQLNAEDRSTHGSTSANRSSLTEVGQVHQTEPSTVSGTSAGQGSFLVMHPPPLPSRVRNDDRRQSLPTRRSSLGSQQPTSSSIGAQRPALNPTRSDLLFGTSDIPSSLDPKLFSAVLARRSADSQKVNKPKSTEVIELSDDSSDAPPQLKGKEKAISPISASATQIQKARNGGARKASNSTMSPGSTEEAPSAQREVIEIFDSDEERTMQTIPRKHLLAPSASKSSKQTQSPEKTDSTTGSLEQAPCSPTQPHMIRRKSDAQTSTPKISSSPGHERTNSSPSTPNLFSSSARKVASRQALNPKSVPTSPTLPRHPQTGSPVAALTARTSTKASTTAHSRANSDVGSSNPEVISKSRRVSEEDGGHINMRDLTAALDMHTLPTDKGKAKENPESQLMLDANLRKSSAQRHCPLKFHALARKSTGSARKSAQKTNSNLRISDYFGTRGSSSALAIDLTSDVSDEEDRMIETQSLEKTESFSQPMASAAVVNAQMSMRQPSRLPTTPPHGSKSLEASSHLPTVKDSPHSPPFLPSPGSPKGTGSSVNLQNHPPSGTSSMTENSVKKLLSPSPTFSPAARASSATHSPFARPEQDTRQALQRPSRSKMASSAERSRSSSSSASRIPSSVSPRVSSMELSHEIAQVAKSLVLDPDSDHVQSSVEQTVTPNDSSSSKDAETSVAELVVDAISDEAMQGADEPDVLVEEGVNSMDGEQPTADDGMRIDSEEADPLNSHIPSLSTVKSSRRLNTLRQLPDSGIDASSERGPSRGSPVSVPSTRRSSRLSSYSNTSEDARLTSLYEERSAVQSVPTSRSTSPEDASTIAIRSRTLGGFPAYRFDSYRMDPKNFPKVHYAADLPSAIQDHMNHQPEEVRKLKDIRKVYEAMILENTADDERDAPPIEIHNVVDDDPTPPWEFWYGNKMWYGEGVPNPDVKNLKGCDCRGACNPKKKACACAIRQCQVIGAEAVDFAYDKNGRLKYPGYPVFECNNTCWCGPECTNRVVQNGRKVQISIRKTVNKGWGVFNGSKKIPRGTFIGIYAGELLTDKVANERGLKYNKAGITYLFDLDFHHQQEVGKDDWVNLYTVDAYHAGNFTRFLNHSCDPNCRLYPCYINEGDIQKPLLVVFSIRDIEPDEEICFNYKGVYPGDDDDDPQQQENGDDVPRDKIYKKCQCGYKHCKGDMFK